jgi:sugar lactone lactonase YvrE
MTSIELKQVRRAKPWRASGATLAGLGWLAVCFSGAAQVSVETIGGGVRSECGSASGFVSGNTYDYAQFNGPYCCALDANGNLWIADKTNNDLEQVSQAGNKAASVTTQYYSVSLNGSKYVTNYHWFTNITSVAVDPANNLYVLLPSPPQVYQCSLSAESTSLNVIGALILTNTPAGALPSAMVVDANSNVFLAFTNGVILRFPLLDGYPPPTVYSNNYALGASANVHYVVTSFAWQPSGLALCANGQLAVSDTLNNAIWSLATNDNSVPHLVTGNHGAGYDDGSPAFATFDQPHGLAASADGSLIVCDTLNNRLRVIDPYANTTTLYGTASNVWTSTCCGCSPEAYYAGWVDGVAGITSTNASGREPVSVVISPNGSLFVTELYYSLLREVTDVPFIPVILNATLPVATTSAATGVTSSNATFNGTVYPGGEETAYYFQYGTYNNYTNFTATNYVTTSLTNTLNVSATVNNLLPSTTYYYFLVTVNSLGVSTSSYLTVVTPAQPAIVVTLQATSITASSATLNASVNPENSSTEVYFQWGTSVNYGNTTSPINLTANLLNTTNVSFTIGNLNAGTTYYYQAVAYNSSGSSYGASLSASTPAAPPVVDTETATGITASNATLNGTVVLGSNSAAYYFEWGLTTSYGNYTMTNTLTNNQAGSQPVSAVIANLTPASVYHFQLVAFNDAGFGYGGDVTATTPTASAYVVTLAATITNTTATLNASVNPENLSTEVYFQWGSSSNFGNSTTPTNLTTNLTNTQPVSTTISNLQYGTIYYFQAVAYNSGGTDAGSVLIFNTPYVPPPALSINPSNGYYPNCVTIAVTSSVPTVYYTTDGTTPTTNSTELLLTNTSVAGPYAGSFEWCNAQQSLSALQLLAGTGTNTTLLQGGYPTSNSIGFPQPLFGGPGAHLYIPVVVNLQSNTPLESVQFRVEITPAPPNTNVISSITLQPLTANDFVPLPGPAPGDAPVNFTNYPYTFPPTEGSVITAEGGSGMDMTASGVVVMLHITIPNTASNGQIFSLNVLDPSGTSDGQQANVGLVALPAQNLFISCPADMVGDSSPSTGYNAGQFGAKGFSNSVMEVGLDNADVNNAIYASAGIHIPPSDSDAFNAMDAFPPDSAGHGGDGLIQFLDWQTILGRSLGVSLFLGMDTNNYLRYWTNGDTTYRSHSVFTNWLAGGSPVPLSLDMDSDSPVGGPAKLSLTNAPPGLVWFCEAAIGSGTVIDAIPGNTYSLPVYVNVLPGYSLAGMQFRAIVTGNSGAPAVTSIQFNPASGVPNPLVLPGLSGNDKIQAWIFGSFATALQNSNYLGTISFEVPSGAYPGVCYALHFSGVDGAPNFTIDYQMESHPGYVWVMTAAQQPASITSDEWKLAFFGSLTNSQAGDDVDADGDGALNWQEYLAGTNPTNSLSRLQFTSANLYTNGLHQVAIDWLTAPGKTYILQSSPAVNGANWTPVNTKSGDGNPYQCIVTNAGVNARFFQILVP